jgi:hypothetical protein
MNEQKTIFTGSCALWRTALSVLIACVLIASIVTLARPKVYEATAEMIDRNFMPIWSTEFPFITDTVASSGPDKNVIETLVKSGWMRERVIHHLPASLRESGFPSLSDDDFNQELRSGLRVLGRVDKSSLILAISFRHRQPSVAAALANAFATESRARIQEAMTGHISSARNDLERLLLEDQAKAKALASDTAMTDTARESELRVLRDGIQRSKRLLAETDESAAQFENRFSLRYAATPADNDYVTPNHYADLGVGCLLGLVASGAVIWRARKRKERLDA